jgi:hypothetical protein
MTSRLTLLIGLTFSPLAGSEVLIQAPQTSEVVFQNVLKSQSDQQTYSQWWLKRRKSLSDEHVLAQDYDQAEQTFLRANLTEAQKLYQTLIDKRWGFDWTNASRVKIFTALLRLASLQTTAAARRPFLEQAAAFDWHLEPDTATFSPPLREEFLTVRKELVMTTVSTLEWPPTIHHILMNGRVFKKTPQLRLPQAAVRLTVLTDGALPLSRIVQPEQLKHIEFNLRPLVAGNCENPQWPQSKTAYPADYKIVFNENCNLTAQPTATPPLESLTLSNVESSNIQPSVFSPTLQTKAPTKQHSIFRSPWFWAGVGSLVIGGFFVYRNNAHSSQTTASPTSSEGW